MFEQSIYGTDVRRDRKFLKFFPTLPCSHYDSHTKFRNEINREEKVIITRTQTVHYANVSRSANK